MPQLDRFLSAMAQYNADTLVLSADSPASFRINGADKAVSQQVLQAEQITSLVSEIAGPEQIESFHRDRSANFRYELQGRRFEGVLEEEAGKVVARLWASTISSVAVEPVSGEAKAEASLAEPPSAAGAEPAVEPVSLEAQRESRATTPVSNGGKQSSAATVPVSFELAHARPADTNSIGVDSSLDAIPRNIPAKYREEMDGLLREMVKLGASDLHLSCQCGPILRVDGCIRPMDGNRPPFTPEHMTQLLFSITPQRNRDEYLHAFDTDFAYAIEGVSRFRVNLFCDRVGPGAVLRAIPNEVISAEKLGLPPVVQELARLNKGLVLATGPTGSGKSTTLASILDIVNRTREEHIITIEDPIEFVHQHKKCHVNQREVGVHTGSFKKALRAALREDPDIVLVGEMRDLETVEIAIETA
ncbi:MAG TPA: ATPase, T2SS/T4P/T4SS family, partial [Candidatus Krumholzibacteria bacterium]|nr:ATPase, T2SS/T4P/T4SS family [Candidatus Krumholzibacteria bacterium]